MVPAARTAAALAVGLVIGVVVTLLAPALTSGGDGPRQDQVAGPARLPQTTAPDDELQRTVMEELQVFTDWLAEHDVDGYIGEVGWPSDQDNPEWSRLADRWFRQANEADLWVSAWAAGSWWPADYPYLAYEAVDDGSQVLPNPQAWVLELHLGTDRYRRGLNVAGAEFGAPGSLDDRTAFSNEEPGVHDVDYRYPDAEDFEVLAARGFDSVRLPFRWERIQPVLGEPLDPDELARLGASVDAAASAGLEVILDLHNYGAYWLAEDGEGVRRPVGSDAVPLAAFADVWRRLSERFADDDGVLAYGLMNEPVELDPIDGDEPARVWERAAQEAVDALRGNGDETEVMVAGYRWSHAGEWTDHHPVPWIDDPADRVRYEAHHYWQDAYTDGYDRARRDAAAAP